MKAINFKLATFSFAAMLLASCSDSNNAVDNGIGKATTVVGSSVEAQYANQLASRVTNYKRNYQNTASKARSIATRSIATRATEPSVPANAKKLSSVTEIYSAHPGEYYVDNDETVNGNGMNIQGMTIYIKKGGKFIYGSAYNNNDTKTNTINVLAGGTLVARNSNEVFGTTKISNYGKIEFPTDQNEYIIKNTYYDFTGDLNVTGHKLNVQGDINTLLFVGTPDGNNGNLEAKEISISGQAQLNCLGNTTLAEGFYMTNQSQAWVNGVLKAKALKLDNSTILYSGCAVKVDNDVYITNGATIHIQYLNAANYYQDSQSMMKLKDQSMVEVDDIYSNLNNGLGKTDLSDKNGVAVIKCKRLIYNAPGKSGDWNTPKLTVDCSTFSTSGDNAHIILEATDGIFSNSDLNNDIRNQNTTILWGNNANVHFYTDDDAKNYTIKKSECNPNGYNDKDNQGTNDKPSLDLITSIDYDTHDHDISATCIQPHNGHMYMSYHTRGTGHGACIEVFKPVENDTVRLEQYLYDSGRDLDFNHLLATKINSGERMVYLPGSSNKKGAMFAYIPIQDNHLLADKSKAITKQIDGKDSLVYEEPLQFIQMNPATAQYTKAGYDENCMVYNDETNHLIVMTTKGYSIYDATTLNELDRIDKPGKAKHVAIGNGKIVTLYLDREATSTSEAIPATIEVFGQKTLNSEGIEDLRNPEATFSISTIEPNNGKNVVAVKDNQIYVCRGAAGMYVYDMKGNELWHYQMPAAQISEGNKKDQYKAYANGCYVGDKYVYIAYGSYGLVVLDKTTHEVVAQRKVSKSANYVVEYNGYIYVAYGQSRMQVFKLCGADPETSYNK